MEKTLSLMKAFEKRNNLSTYFTLCSDGSGTLFEFWDEEKLVQFVNVEELNTFLTITNYKKSDDGKCLSPVVILN